MRVCVYCVCVHTMYNTFIACMCILKVGLYGFIIHKSKGKVSSTVLMITHYACDESCNSSYQITIGTFRQSTILFMNSLKLLQ